MSGHAIVNVEGSFALAVLGVMLWRSRRLKNVEDRLLARAAQTDLLLVASIVLLTCAVFWRSTRIPFVSDDYVLVNMGQNFTGNYWINLTHGGGDGFFRPIGYVSIWWTWPLAHWNPVAWHWAGLALHIANALMVYAIAAMIGLSRAGAWFASAFFALHGAHPEAAVWIAGRFDLLATLFVLAGLAAFIRLWDRPSASWAVAAGLALILGALSKESAYAFPLLMLVYAASRPGTWNRRLRFVAPFFFLAAALFVYRWVLQGGIGGYVTGTGAPQVLGLRPAAILEGLAFRLWAILFFPIDWARSVGVWLWAAIAASCAAWGAIAWKSEARSEKLLLPLGLTLAAAIPAIPLLLIGADLEKARVLYLPSAGFCLLAAAATEMTAPKLRVAASAAMLLFSLAALRHNLAIWEDVAARSQTVCEAVAECMNAESATAPRTLDGVYFFANGLPECVRHERSVHPDLALHTCPPEVK